VTTRRSTLKQIFCGSKTFKVREKRYVHMNRNLACFGGLNDGISFSDYLCTVLSRSGAIIIFGFSGLLRLKQLKSSCSSFFLWSQNHPFIAAKFSILAIEEKFHVNVARSDAQEVRICFYTVWLRRNVVFSFYGTISAVQKSWMAIQTKVGFEDRPGQKLRKLI